MLRPYSRMFLSGLPFMSSNNETEDVSDLSPTERELNERIAYMESLAPLSGWERVKIVYSKDEYGNTSPYASSILQATFGGAMLGGMYGGIKKSQVAYLDFMRTNQATKFESHLDAKRDLQNKFSIAFFKGAAQLGWRTGLFGFLFSSVSTTVSAYRYKDGVLEYTLGGAAAGASYRVSLGMRGMIVGCILGMALGTIAGTMNVLLLRLTGISMNEIRSSQHLFLESRKRADKGAMQNAERELSMPENATVLTKVHEDELSGKKYDELENIKD